MSDPRVPDDDELELGGRPVPRWVFAVAALAAVGVVVGVLVAQSSGTRRAALRSSPPSASVSAVPGPSLVVPTGVGEPLPIGTLTPLSVATAGRRTWVLQAGSISVYDGVTRIVGPRSVPDIDFGRDNSIARLVLDAARARVWVLVSDRMSATWLREYDAYSLRPTRSVSWSGAASDATLLAGRLYLVSNRGTGPLDGGRLRVLIPSVQDGVVTADPIRSRLLVLPAVGTTIWTIDSSGVPHAARLPAEVSKGTLAVTDAGSIWLGGYSSSGPILAELDPATFQITRRSRVTAHVGPGAILLGAGHDHVFVRPGDGPSGLWCVDSRTGAPDQFWPIDPVAVAAQPGNTVAVAGGDALQLRLRGRCTTP